MLTSPVFKKNKHSKLIGHIYTSIPSDLAFAHTSGLKVPPTPFFTLIFLNLLSDETLLTVNAY